jgi:hypothetical protein
MKRFPRPNHYDGAVQIKTGGENMATATVPRTVYIGVPKRIGDDLKHITAVTAQVLGKLGCGGCHSGFDLRFVPDPFIFNEKGELASGPIAG